MDTRGRFARLLLLALPAWTHAQGLDQKTERKYELGGLITYSRLRGIGSTDSGTGTEVGGFGGRFGYRLFRHLDLDTELNFLPGNSATSGNHVQGFVGAKAGMRWSKGGVFLKVRPGFIRFSRDPFGVGKPGTAFLSHERAASTEPAVDFGGVVEYYTSRGFVLRFDLGYDLVYYARRDVRSSPTLPSFQAGGFTTHNWQASVGVTFRF